MNLTISPQPNSPIIISQCGIPRILPPSSTMGDNGAWTVGTALPYTTYPVSCYCYFSGFAGNASFATNVMTVTSATSGNLTVGSVIVAAGVTAGTTITSLGTGLGGTGTYNLSTSPGTISAAAMTASVLGRTAGNTVPAEGLYYTVLSSSTSGTVYNNTYDPTTGIAPTIPASPTAFVTTGGGAYTQVLTGSPNGQIKLTGRTVAGGSMGANGSVAFSFARNWNNSANNKSFKLYIGSTSIVNGTDTTSAAVTTDHTFMNLGSQTRNKMVGAGLGDGAGSSGFTYGTFDTSSDVTFVATYALATATDYAIIDFTKAVLAPFS